MQVRLSAKDQHAFRFLASAKLRARGRALWLAGQDEPIAVRHESLWQWQRTRYDRADFTGPATVEFWNDVDKYPRESLGPFGRLSLQNRALLHGRFVIAYYDGSLNQWASTGSGRHCEELHIRGCCTAFEVSRRRQMIEDAAYFHAERRGFSPGCQEDDWLQAEARIDAQLWFHRSHPRPDPMPLKVSR